jgi:glutaredoxin-like protein NrdH
MFEYEVTNKIPILLALSTCPRCTRMKKFLNNNNVNVKVVDVDLLSIGEKKSIYRFMQPYNPSLNFPTMIVGGMAVVGEDYDSARRTLDL